MYHIKVHCNPLKKHPIKGYFQSIFKQYINILSPFLIILSV